MDQIAAEPVALAPVPLLEEAARHIDRGMRIERPAPIIDGVLEDARNRAESWLLWAESGTDDGRRGDAAAFRLLLGNPVTQPLTREQIAKAICRPGDTSKWPLLGITEYCGTCWTVAEGLLGLPQNGADRG